MRRNPIAQMKGKTAELSAEAGKMMRHSALGAAHRALILARRTVQSADEALQEALPPPKRRKSRIARWLKGDTKRKTAKATRRRRVG